MVSQFESYQSPFTWRYGTPEMRQIFSEFHKYQLWRNIWVALAQVEHTAGLVTKEELDDLMEFQDTIDIERIVEIEKSTKHDVVAAIQEYAEKATIGGGKIHFGATSMDIVDNAEMMRVMEGLALIEKSLSSILHKFSEHMEIMCDTPCIGYTHLQPAEPTTVGYRLAFYAQDLLIDLETLAFVRSTIRGKGMKGAVGTSASYRQLLTNTKITAEQLDQEVMGRLGIKSSLITTQVYTRKFDYLVELCLASIASSCAKFASDLRILQSPAYGEWSEPFDKNQVGSSAMPFKKNPVSSEKICSLARYIAQLPAVILENATLSHLERTLDDSANRRIIMSESFLAVDEILNTIKKILGGLVFHEKKITYNLNQYAPFAATEPLLILLVKKGADRQKMHETLRIIALKSWDGVTDGKENPMKSLLQQENQITQLLTKQEIDRCFDVKYHVGDASERTTKLVAKIRRVTQHLT